MTAGRCCLAKLITRHCDWLFLKTALRIVAGCIERVGPAFSPDCKNTNTNTGDQRQNYSKWCVPIYFDFFFCWWEKKIYLLCLRGALLRLNEHQRLFLDYRFNAVRSDVQRATKFDDGVPKLQREKASSLTRLPRLIFAQETVSLIVKYAKALKYPSPSICPSEEADLWRGYKGAAYLSKFLHKALIILLLFLYVMTFLILVREECSVTNCVKSVWRHSRQAGRWGT